MIFNKIRIYKNANIDRIIEDIDMIIYHSTGTIRIIIDEDKEILIEKKDYDWFDVI